MSRTAVLAMAYGTIASLDELEAYYTHIRRGRAPTPELLAQLRERYAAIGGRSPLLELTQAQTRGLRELLAQAGHEDVTVGLGMKHAAPFIEDAVADLAAEGAREIVGIVLAPHFSRGSVGEYTKRAQEAAAATAGRPRVRVVESWHLQPAYIELLGANLQDQLRNMPPHTHVLFTAHSLPLRVLTDGDPYPDQLAQTAAAVAELVGCQDWSVAWQSAGRTADPWIGPDVLEALDTVAAAGAQGAVVCAAGFVTDHLEVLYDLDIEAKAHAEALGLQFARTASPNDDPRLLSALAEAVLAQLNVATR
jgi:ferrochelatase